MNVVVLLNLDQNKEREVVWWARENCPSFHAWYVYQDSDNEPLIEEWDSHFKFMFGNERDAIIFQLRWQGQTGE